MLESGDKLTDVTDRSNVCAAQLSRLGGQLMSMLAAQGSAAGTAGAESSAFSDWIAGVLAALQDEMRRIFEPEPGQSGMAALASALASPLRAVAGQLRDGSLHPSSLIATAGVGEAITLAAFHGKAKLLCDALATIGGGASKVQDLLERIVRALKLLSQMNATPAALALAATRRARRFAFEALSGALGTKGMRDPEPLGRSRLLRCLTPIEKLKDALLLQQGPDALRTDSLQEAVDARQLPTALETLVDLQTKYEGLYKGCNKALSLCDALLAADHLSSLDQGGMSKSALNARGLLEKLRRALGTLREHLPSLRAPAATIKKLSDMLSPEKLPAAKANLAEVSELASSIVDAMSERVIGAAASAVELSVVELRSALPSLLQELDSLLSSQACAFSFERLHPFIRREMHAQACVPTLHRSTLTVLLTGSLPSPRS